VRDGSSKGQVVIAIGAFEAFSVFSTERAYVQIRTAKLDYPSLNAVKVRNALIRTYIRSMTSLDEVGSDRDIDTIMMATAINYRLNNT